jgi:ArsR family transcriptional regulator
MTGTENVFKALGDRNRLRILASLLCHNELCACQIHEWLGVTGATASKHLSLLVDNGLIESRKEGRWVHYRINRNNPAIRPLINWIKKQVELDDALQSDLKKLEPVASCTPLELRKKQRDRAACC